MSEAAPIDKLREMLAGGPDPTTLTIAEQRAGMEQYVAINPPRDDMRVEETEIVGVPCDWVSVDSSRDDRIIFYTHGGAYIAGSPKTHQMILAELAHEAKAQVLAVDYRLAPEHTFPAAVDDSLAVYEAISDQIGQKKSAIAGDSAGGALAVSTLLAAKEKGLPLCDAAALLSPWADLTCTGKSYESHATADFIVRAEVSRNFAQMYLDGASPKTPLASPVFADLSGLPPMLIQVGSAEILLDDSLLLDRNARAANVEVTLEVWPEMIHVWQAFTALLPEAKQALHRIGRYLEKNWDS